MARGWTIERVATASGTSRWSIYMLERGESTSLELVIRVLTALGLRLEVEAVDPRRRARVAQGRPEDPVHAAMGEFEAAHLRAPGFEVGIDEPYQHYQFAGRADVIAWKRSSAVLLHLENRTQFPNMQDMAGSWNAKRAYLAGSLGERFGLRFRSVTHVMVAAWTAEVLHALRLHPQSFRSLAPDPADAFDSWWQGRPAAAESSSTLILLDPMSTTRQRTWINLELALGGARPRYRDYRELAIALGPERRKLRT